MYHTWLLVKSGLDASGSTNRSTALCSHAQGPSTPGALQQKLEALSASADRGSQGPGSGLQLLMGRVEGEFVGARGQAPEMKLLLQLLHHACQLTVGGDKT